MGEKKLIMRVLVMLLLCVVVVFASTKEEEEVKEYQIKIQAGTDELFKKIFLEHGVSMDRPKKDAKEWNGYCTNEQLQALKKDGIKYRKVQHEGRAAAKREAKEAKTRTVSGYHNYDALQTFISTTVARYPQWCKKFVIGKSVRNRELVGIQLTTHSSLNTSPRPQ